MCVCIILWWSMCACVCVCVGGVIFRMTVSNAVCLYQTGLQ